MKVGLWAEIRRLAEIEKLSARVISRRLRCSWRTVAKVLQWGSWGHEGPGVKLCFLFYGGPGVKLCFLFY